MYDGVPTSPTLVDATPHTSPSSNAPPYIRHDVSYVVKLEETWRSIGHVSSRSFLPPYRRPNSTVAAHVNLMASRTEFCTAADQLTQITAATHTAASALAAAQDKVQCQPRHAPPRSSH